MIAINEFEILKNVDRYFTILKNLDDNCAIGLLFNDNKGVSLRLNKDNVDKQLKQLDAELIGSTTIMTWDLIQNFEKVNGYKLNIKLFGEIFPLEVTIDPYNTTYPTVLIPANVFDTVELNYKTMKAVIKVDTDKLRELFDKTSAETRKMLDSKPFAGMYIEEVEEEGKIE